MEISIELDRENDQLYLLFRPGAVIKGSIAKTVRLTEDVVGDLDADGRLIGLDVSQASKMLGIEDLERLSVAVAIGGGRRARS